MSPSYRNVPDRFLVAFSFAGEQRELVRAIAEAVEQRLGRGRVFYAAWFESQLAGSAADLKLQHIYSEQAELVVVCASQAYGGKAWPIVEWDAIRARHNNLRADPDRQAADRILPLRVADGEVEGLLSNAIWVEARNRPAKETAGLIVQRLRQFVPHAGKPGIFLAECTSDLEDPDKPVNRQRLKAFLEEDLDWCVLPREPLSELPADQYRSRLEADLRQCLAFAQLLGPYPWKGGGYDRVQFDAATQQKLPTFRFRGDIDLDKVRAANPAHHQFITDGVIAAGFEDFKQLLREKLTALAQQREQAIKRAQDEEQRPVDDANPPLVRVAIRAQQPDALWEPIFQLLYEQEKILADQLGPGETFKEKHLGEPCHGFLILCDGSALADDQHSPRGDMEHCRLIQMKAENFTRQPPVAIVYWPPPQPSWAKLLKSIPNRLIRVEGDRLSTLAEFLEQVRQVRRASL